MTQTIKNLSIYRSNSSSHHPKINEVTAFDRKYSLTENEHKTHLDLDMTWMFLMLLKKITTSFLIFVCLFANLLFVETKFTRWSWLDDVGLVKCEELFVYYIRIKNKESFVYSYLVYSAIREITHYLQGRSFSNFRNDSSPRNIHLQSVP